MELVKEIDKILSTGNFSERVHPEDVNDPELALRLNHLLSLLDCTQTELVDCQAGGALQEALARELKHVERFMSEVINAMPSMLIGIDEDKKIIEWNEAAASSTGRSVMQAMGKPLNEVLKVVDGLDYAINHALETKTPVVVSEVPIHHRGEYKRWTILIYPLSALAGSGAVIRVDDVTEHVQVRERLVQSEKMLSVGGLASGMAHEINNPLSGITQGISTIRRRLSPDLPVNREKAEELGLDLVALDKYLNDRNICQMFDGMQELAERASQIVKSMLHFNRTMDLSYQDIPTKDLLEKSIKLALHECSMAEVNLSDGISVTADCDSAPSTVRCLDGELKQVLVNLIRNALSALSKTKQDDKHVIVRCTDNSHDVCIEVIDNGPGIPPEIVSKVFEPFFTTKATGKGIGLGLAISYFIICTKHKGHIFVESQPGQTVFTISLPKSI